MNENTETKKMDKCKYYRPNIKGRDGKLSVEHYCAQHDNLTETDEEKCEKCKEYKSKFIEYPIEVSKINNDFGDDWTLGCNVGDLIAIRPCEEKYNKKTYLAVSLGSLPLNNHISYNTISKELNVFPHRNPAFYVFELKKVIYGAESFWHKIKSIDDLKEITDEDINNTWYVKMLKEMSAFENEE